MGIKNVVAGILMVAAIFVAVEAHAQTPADISTPAGADVEEIVTDAAHRGGRVILKKIEYVGGEGVPFDNKDGVPGEKIRSKTYIEIDTRPSVLGEEGLIESQKKVEGSQREMMKALGVIGEGQKKIDERVGTVEVMSQDVTSGMKVEAREQSAVRGETADTGSKVSEVDRTVQDSTLLLEKIDAQIRSLSTAVGELSSRLGEVKESVDGMGEETVQGLEQLEVAGEGEMEGAGVAGAPEESEGEAEAGVIESGESEGEGGGGALDSSYAGG
jgi:hypothetical protein